MGCILSSGRKVLVNAVTGEVKSFQKHLYDYATYQACEGTGPRNKHEVRMPPTGSSR
jgi:hypothetical protein